MTPQSLKDPRAEKGAGKRKKSARSKPLAFEYAGNVEFPSVGVAPAEGEPSWADWQQRAKDELVMVRLTVPFLNMDDEELAKVVGNDPESFMEFAESCELWRGRHEDGAKLMGAMFARLMICLQRVMGKEEMERLYAEKGGKS